MKIGYTSRRRPRLATMQTGNADKLTIPSGSLPVQDTLSSAGFTGTTRSVASAANRFQDDARR